MEAIVSKSAGLDVHSESVVASVVYEKEGEEVSETRHFGVVLRQRETLCRWLLEQKVDVVVMESTGIYWRNLYRDLTAAGLRVQVVNARHVKHVPGRKTDVLDSQWLAKLGRYGLLRPSFVPSSDFQDLRLISRYRMKLRDIEAGERNRLQKVLIDAGIYLGNVVSDIHGVSSMRIIEGLIAGKPIEELIQRVHGRLNPKKDALREALEGFLRDAHRIVLKAIVAHIKMLELEIFDLERQLLLGLKPYQRELDLLQTIAGFDVIASMTLLVEIGPDMQHFGSAKRLASWAGICPGQNESAGKRYSGRVRKGNQMVRRILCQVAHAVRNSKTQFQSKYQSLLIRRGVKRTVIAVAHKILRVVFAVLRDKKPYREPGIDYEALAVARNAPRWIRALEKFGYKVENKVTRATKIPKPLPLPSTA